MSNSVINVSLPSVDKLLSELIKPLMTAAGQPEQQDSTKELMSIPLSELQIYTLVDVLDEAMDSRTSDAIDLLNKDALDKDTQAQVLNMMDEVQGLKDLENHLLYQMLG